MTHKFLTTEEVQSMTGLIKPKCQLKWLRKNGIDALMRGDNTVLVLWSAVEAKIGRQEDKKNKSVQPNWGAMRGKAA